MPDANDGEPKPPAASEGVLESWASHPYQSLTADGEILSVNDAWLESLGYDRDEVIGKQFGELLTADSKTPFETSFEEFKASGEISDAEFEMKRSDGDTIVVSVDGKIEYDDHGQVIRAHCQFWNVSDWKRTEHELRQQRDRLRAITDTIPDIVIRYDPAGTVKEVMTGQEQLLVSAPEELEGSTIDEMLNPQAAEKIQSAIDKALQTQEVTSTEYRLQIDGESVWFEGNIAPFGGQDTDEVVMSVRDITERKAQTEELRHTKERLKLAIEGANLGVWDWDMETDEVTRHVNLRKMLGYSPAEFGSDLGDWDQLVHPEGKAKHDEALQSHIQNRSDFYECDYRLRAKSGDWKWIRNIGKVVEWTADGSPQRAVGIHIDIDEQKRNYQELVRKTDQLEALNRVVRHDIRNDMNLIYGWAQQLERYIDEEAETALERILEASEHVIDLTEVAREFVENLEASETVPMQAVALAHYIKTEVQAQQEKHPEAEIQIDGTIPNVSVRGTEMLSSAFRNLIVNAIQHNDSRKPEVHIRTTEEADTVTVRVADNGPGIPDEHKDRVFGKGEKGLESEGTGLGLYLVGRIVEGSGGEVRIEDNEPEGTVFVVTLQKADSAVD